MFRAFLNFAGRHGPAMLVGGAGIGLAIPVSASLARPLMPVAVFVFTFGAFLKVDLAAFRATLENRVWVPAALAWSTFGVPALMVMLVAIAQPNDDLAQGMMLCALAPPVGSAAAIAAMLELDTAFALLATVAATLLSPAILPPLAALTGAHVRIDAIEMTIRLTVIVGGACLAATLTKRYAATFVRENPHAMTGVSVLGLILVAIGAMDGMRAFMFAHPTRVMLFLSLAFAVNIGFHLIGTALFLWGGMHRAMTLGLVAGNRNITLAWAASGSMLVGHPNLELYLAMSVLPIFLLPAVWRLVLRPASPTSRIRVLVPAKVPFQS